MVVCAADCVIEAEPAETAPPLGIAAYTGAEQRKLNSTNASLRFNALSEICIRSNRVQITRFDKEAHELATHTTHIAIFRFCLMNLLHNQEPDTEP